MFTEYGNEGNDCCPELTQSDSLPFKVLRWILMSLQLMKDPDLAAEVTYLAEDSDLSEWHLELLMEWETRLELSDKRDKLARADLISLLQALGHCPNEQYLEQMLEELGIDKKTTFTFGDTCFVWQKFIQNYDDELKLLQKAFQFFDKDNNGSLSVEEFRTANRELGNLLTDEEIMSFVEIVDVTQDGDIQYDELLASLMTQYTTVSNEVISRQSSRMIRSEDEGCSMASPSAQPAMSRDSNGAGAPGPWGEISYSEAASGVQPAGLEVDGGTYQALILDPDTERLDESSHHDRQPPKRDSTEHLILHNASSSVQNLIAGHDEINQAGESADYLPGQPTSQAGNVSPQPVETIA